MTTGKGRGFASLTPEQRREASKAGNAALREYGLSHQWTREQATAAGAKGNAVPRTTLTVRPLKEVPA